MEKLVNEIVSWINTTSKADKKLCTAATGIILYTLFFLIVGAGFLTIFKVINAASPKVQEVVTVICLFLAFAAFLIFIYYLVKYCALFFITMFQYGIAPSFKNRDKSIEAIMTSEVDDKKRLHKGILSYLTEYSTSRCFAALYIWLNEKQLLEPLEQTRFIDVLKTDFPDSSSNETDKKGVIVPSTSSLSESKTKLEKDDKKEYREGGYDQLFEKRFRRYLKE